MPVYLALKIKRVKGSRGWSQKPAAAYPSETGDTNTPSPFSAPSQEAEPELALLAPGSEEASGSWQDTRGHTNPGV